MGWRDFIAELRSASARKRMASLLMCEIDRDYVSLEITKRGSRVRGSAKIAYRQGDVL